MKDELGREVENGDFIALQAGDIGILSKEYDSDNYLFHYLDLSFNLLIEDGKVVSRYLQQDEKFFIYYRSEKC